MPAERARARPVPHRPRVGAGMTGDATAAPPPTRRQLQRAASVARIVSATETLLSEAERFSDISVEQILVRAGVSRSTFYTYFDDMGHLLRVVGEGVIGDVVSAARRWMDRDSGVDEAELRVIFTDLFATYRSRATLMAALADASAYDQGVREEFHRLFAIGHVELGKHIRRAQKAGGARSDIDPESTAAWLVWMIERGLYQQVRHARPKDVDRHVASLAAIVWHALYAADPA